MQLKFKNHVCKSKVLKNYLICKTSEPKPALSLQETYLSLALCKVNASKILLSHLCPELIKGLTKHAMGKSTEQTAFFLVPKSHHCVLSLGTYISFQPPNHKTKNSVKDSMQPGSCWLHNVHRLSMP